MALPFRLGRVNCYLVEGQGGFVLIDSGCSSGRAELEKGLNSAVSRVEELRLIVLTHGDFDHCGNAAYVRANWGARIAMHPADAGMAEKGDMWAGRSASAGASRAVISRVSALLFRFGKRERFDPDIAIEEGADLGEYGLEARVVALPGHSQGSVGVLTCEGALFCGDLLVNHGTPMVNTLVDDAKSMEASVLRLSELGVKRIYPGHGEPFTLEQFLETKAV